MLLTRHFYFNITGVVILLYQALNGNHALDDDMDAIHPPLVDTIYGPVRGIFTPEGIQAYLGIPYAKPPVEELRWKAPMEPRPWGPEVFNAFQVSPGCPTRCFDTVEAFCPRQVSIEGNLKRFRYHL